MPKITQAGTLPQEGVSYVRICLNSKKYAEKNVRSDKNMSRYPSC